MANATENVIDRRLHGKFGKFCIFRTINFKTFMSPYPDYSKRTWSKNQKAVRMRFRDAVIWTRQTLENPGKRRYYQKKAKPGQSVWNAGVGDYMKKPQINLIDVQGYKGRKGDVIHIKARDNYLIKTVMITLLNAMGVEIESFLIPNLTNFVNWEYKAMEPNPDWQGGRVVVRVTDSPGNVTEDFRVL